MYRFRRELFMWGALFNVLVLVGGVYLYRNFASYRSANPTSISTAEAAAQELTKETDKLRSLDSEYKSSGGQNLVKREEAKFQAQRRKEKLKELIKIDPDLARKSLLQKDELQTLSPDIQEQLEKPVSVSGTYTIVVSDNFNEKTSQEMHYLKLAEHDYHTIYGVDSEISSQSHVVVNGMQIDTIILANGEDDSVKTDVLAATSPAMTKGQKRLGIIALNFTDNQLQPYTIQAIRNIVYYKSAGTVNAFFGETSANQLSYKGVIKTDGDIFGWYTIQMSQQDCDLNKLASLAEQAASAHGFNASSYDNVAYVTPRAYCNSGQGELAGKRLWLNSSSLVENGGLLYLFKHELGHTLGAHHANSYLCKYPSGDEASREGFALVWSSYCRDLELHDYYEIMGGSDAQQFSTYHKDYFGWLTSTNKVTIDQNGKTTITLAPMENVLARNTLIVTIPGTSFDYYVEYRQPIGSIDKFLTGDTALQGVLIRFVRSLRSGYDRPHILYNGFPSETINEVALPFGKMYSDDVKNVYIKAESGNTSGATVTVYRGTTPTAPTPTATIRLSPTVQITPAITSSGGSISHQQTVTGGSSNSNRVTSGSVSAASGNIYLASVSTRTNIAVSSMSGMGLTWTRVAAQCAGRAQTRVEIWKGTGTPSSGAVTANLSSSSKNSVIAVSRYSGASSQNNIIDPVTRNTRGVNGACSGGTDSSSFSYTVSNSNSKFVYVAAALRNKTFSPGSGYTERAEKSQGSSGDKVGIAIMDRSSTSSSTPVSGTFSSSTDWAIGNVELY